MEKPLADFRLMSREFQNESYAFYARLQQEAPVYRMPDTGVFLITRFEDIKKVSLDTETFSNKVSYGLIQGERWAAYEHLLDTEGFGIKRVLNGADPPEHRRIRKYLDSVLNARSIEALKPRIQAVADMLIDRFIDRGSCDFVAEFASLLPAIIIAEHFGLDPDNLDNFRKWSDNLAHPTNHVLSEEELLACARVEVEMQHYLHVMIESRRVDPQPDLLTRIVQDNSAENVEGDPLSDKEIINILRDFIAGGFGTVVNMLSNALYLLLKHPAEMTKLRNQPDLLKNFMDESLRIETAIQIFPRITTRDVEMHGVTIPSNSLVALCFGAANHDPSKFSCPHMFDIERTNAASHLTFNVGPHTCPGRLLARQELMISFETILRRMSDIRLTEELDYPHMANWRHRVMERLPIKFERAR